VVALAEIGTRAVGGLGTALDLGYWLARIALFTVFVHFSDPK
jgi:hypothetical protein